MKIGIVLATYNPNFDYLTQQIRSLVDQEFKNWQCLIVDDGSNETTLTRITELARIDKRFSLEISQRNLGVKFNFERGLKVLPNDCNLIAFCDQDDIWLPEKLSEMCAVFEDPSVLVAHSDMRLINSTNDVISQSCWKSEKRALDSDLRQICLRNPVTGCSMMFRREILEFALPFPDDTQTPSAYLHDHWIAACGALMGKVVFIKKPLLSYRQHPGNVVGAFGKSKQKGNLFIKSRIAWQIRKKLVTDLAARVQLKSHLVSPLALDQLENLKAAVDSLLLSSFLILKHVNRSSLRLLLQRWLAELQSHRS